VGMSTLRKALFSWLFAASMALPLAAQLTDCAFTRTFTTDANLTSSSNLSGQTPCVNWRVTYSVTGTLTSTVTFQTSPDNTNWTSVPNTLCSSTVQPPCILQGTNPLTGTTQGMSLFAAYGAYVRVITSGSAGSGTGTIRGYGAKGATAAVSGGNSVGGGNVTSAGPLTLDAVILGNGGLDIKAGAVLPGDAGKFYDGTGNFTIPPSASLLKPCVVIIGDPGAASPALANDNDSPVACGNSWGSDWTILSVACWANTGSPTITPILTAGNATSVLTGALTCGTAAWAPGTVNGSPAVHTFSANGSTCAATPCTIDVNITTAGGTAKYIVVRIVGTL
jgi:hypothetical protein